ncbi:SAGA-associated factor 29 family protein [Phanerochaete sordida]|uniref:SAGA-associated factor 29 family protein n=1 Tax=Phanerochaete sordida TaxID=48140 RepID=A0A9P3GLL6_9APHY|nr:SAGA-associated factor 29 family protein [Phanerochaete sordida]
MANRRGLQPRPITSEELDCWTQTVQSLPKLAELHDRTNETVGRLNRGLAAWPADDTLPAEGYSYLKSNYKMLVAALKELQNIGQEDIKAIDETLERLDILIALRKASETIPPEKRNKRPRGQSPSGTATPVTVATNPGVVRGVSITVPPRSSVGPPAHIPFSREPKARREALHKQLPLRPGRKVAFHPPSNTSKAADTGGKDEEWILAVVTKSINQDKNRYEVQDPEPQEDGSPGQCYNTTLRGIIPLPDITAPPDSAAHLNAYPEFQAGQTVMALYPDTSCFYRAEVIESPTDMARDNPSAKVYKLKFEDDDDQEHLVAAQWVVEWPGA